MTALREAATRNYLQKDAMAALQRLIVDKRFANEGCRDSIGAQNNGTLSKAKRALEEFAQLTGGEIAALESVVREAFGLPG